MWINFQDVAAYIAYMLLQVRIWDIIYWVTTQTQSTFSVYVQIRFCVFVHVGDNDIVVAPVDLCRCCFLVIDLVVIVCIMAVDVVDVSCWWWDNE